MTTPPKPGAIHGQSDTVGGKSYAHILKSSTIIGGSSVINVLTGIVRVKVNAVLLGLSGVGLFGLYNSIIEFATVLASLGLRSSGVRQIAAAAGTGDLEKLSRTTTTLRRLVLGLGFIAAIGLFLLRKPVCTLTFGTEEHASEVGALALVILFTSIAGGQGALVQGMRRIGDLARISIIGAVLGTVIGATIIYLLRERGIVVSLVAVAGMGILTSWWYARKIRVVRVNVGWGEFSAETRRLISLGLVVMAGELMAAGVAYTTRLLIARHIGLDAVGLYQSASTLSLIYVGFILQAMGTDFYPRLAAVATDDRVCNRLVNEQAEIGLLLAVPGILATLAFAPLAISLFYSAKFSPAAEILRWQILGMFFRVATWPMSIMLSAKGLKTASFCTQLLFTGVNLGLVWICLQIWGLKGAGMATFGSFLFYWVMIFLLVRRVSGFAWSPANARLGRLLLPAVGVVFAFPLLLPPTAATVAGGAVALAVGLYNLKLLQRTVGSGGFDFIKKRLPRFGS